MGNWLLVRKFLSILLVITLLITPTYAEKSNLTLDELHKLYDYLERMGVPTEIELETSDNKYKLRINIGTIYNKGLVVYGYPEEVLNIEGENDYKDGEYRYLGYDINYNLVSNENYPDDVSLGLEIWEKNWTYKPWSCWEVKYSYNGIDEMPVINKNNPDLAAEYLRTIDWVAKMGWTNDELVNYLAIQVEPTEFTQGSARGWHDYGGNIYYQTFTIQPLEEVDLDEVLGEPVPLPGVHEPISEGDYLIPEHKLTLYKNSLYNVDNGSIEENERLNTKLTANYPTGSTSGTYDSHKRDHTSCSYPVHVRQHDHNIYEYQEQPDGSTKRVKVGEREDSYHRDYWEIKWNNVGQYEVEKSNPKDIIKDFIMSNNEVDTTSESYAPTLNVDAEILLSRAYAGDKPTIAEWRNSRPSDLSEFPTGYTPVLARGGNNVTNTDFDLEETRNRRLYIKDYEHGLKSDESITLDYDTNNNLDLSLTVGTQTKLAADKSGAIGGTVKGYWVDGDTYRFIDVANNINFYPSYKMQYDTLSSQDNDIYMVGDKQRTLQPLTLHEINIDKGSFAMQALFASDANAKALSQKLGGYPVLICGGYYSLWSDSNIKLNIDTYALRLKDTFRSQWSGTDTTSDQHSTFVNGFYNDMNNTLLGLYEGSTSVPNSELSGKYYIDRNMNVSKSSTSSSDYDITYSGSVSVSLNSSIISELKLQDRLSAALESDGWYQEETQAFEVVKYSSSISVSKSKLEGILSINLGPESTDGIKNMYSKGEVHDFKYEPTISFNTYNGNSFGFILDADSTGFTRKIVIPDVTVGDLKW